MKEKCQEIGGVVDHVHVDMNYWKHLWKLKMPPSLLHFLWRGSVGFIPCMEALHWKRISSSAICFRCQQARESILHATWNCPHCVVVLERLRFYNVLASTQFNSFAMFLEFAVKTLSEQEFQLLVILLWMNWRERNNAHHGSAVTQPHIIYEQGINYQVGLLEVQAKKKEVQCRQEKAKNGGSSCRWRAPTTGILKLNCDGAFNDRLGHYGGGAILRDEFGVLVAAVGEAYSQKGTVCFNELLAIKLGLQMVLERRSVGVEVESDSLEAVRLVNEGEQCFNIEGVVVEEIRKLMFLLNISSIHHVLRDGNKAAHSIAVNVAREQGRFSWLEVGPPWLMSVILDDMPLTVSSVRDMSSSQPSSEVFGTRYSQSRLCNLF